MELSAPKLCSATIAHPDFSRHTWAKTPGLGCSKTSAVEQPISGCCRYVYEVAHEPPERLVVVALVGGVDALRSVEAVGQGRVSLRFWALEKPPLSPAVHCLGVRTASRPRCGGFRPSRSPRRRRGPESLAGRRRASRPSAYAAGRRRAWRGAVCAVRAHRAACLPRGRRRRKPLVAHRLSACRG